MFSYPKPLDEDGTMLNGGGSRGHHEDCDGPSTEDSRTPDFVITIEVKDSQGCGAVTDNYNVAHPILNAIVTKTKPVLTQRVHGKVKCFNAERGYGFVNRSETREDVFVHRTAML